MLHRPDAHAEITRAAEQTIRSAIAGGVSDAVMQLGDETQLSLLDTDTLQDAICERLGKPNIGWALAYVAGVQLAPSILQAAGGPKQAQPEHSTPDRRARDRGVQESDASQVASGQTDP